jgi:hypothetical protein
MSLVTKQITVTTNAQLIEGSDNVRRDILLHAKHASWIGGQGVTTTTGFLLDNGDHVRMTLFEGDVLYVITDSGSGTLYASISAQT